MSADRVRGRNEPSEIAPRLYGLVGAEHLYTDPATVYESEVEDQMDPLPDRIEIEEWSVAPQRSHLIDAGSLLEHIHETACDNSDTDEGWCDHMADAVAKPDVIAATESLLDLIASKNQYLMADRLVATHVLTFDANGEPLYDGEPMYHGVAS